MAGPLDTPVDIPTERLVHDLQGPLNNIVGFSLEIRDALSELPRLIDQYRDELPIDFQQSLAALIEQDFSPCLKCLLASTEILSARVDSLSPDEPSSSVPVKTGTTAAC